MILNDISHIKIHVKIVFITDITSYSESGIPYLSSPKTTVFIKTERVIKLSKKGPFTKFLSLT
jgi:hypothetical protein